MRVLLFTQSGSERPKVARYSPSVCAHRPTAAAPESCGCCRGTGYAVEPWASLKSTDRWFLVECENADAGRRLIAAFKVHRGRILHASRILASGGKP